MKTALMSFVLLAALSLNIFAQVSLPEGAAQRIGKGAIWEIAYSPDGERLAVASSIGVWLYDARTGAELSLINGTTYGITSIAFSPDGRTLAIGDNWPNKTIRLWDMTTGTHKATLDGETASGESVVFSPDGRTLASLSYDRSVRLWDVATGALKVALDGHRHWITRSRVTSVAFTPNGRTLATGNKDGSIRLWDVATGAEKLTLEGHKNRVNDVVFSPDGATLASASRDDTVRLWDVETGRHKLRLVGHTMWVERVVYSPDGLTIASASGDSTLRLWDAVTGARLRTLKGHAYGVNSIAFSPDGKTLASGGWDYTMRLWDAATGDLKQTIGGHTGLVESVAFSPDGRTLAIGSGNPFPSFENNNIRFVDTQTGNLERILESDVPWPSDIPWPPIVAYSPDGHTLASNAGDDIHLWDMAAGAKKLTLEGHTQSVHAFAYSPDGRLLASGSDDKTVRFWNAETGEYLRTLVGSTVAIKSVAFSPDGRILAGAGGGIRMWDAVTGELLRTLHGHRDWVNSVAFSPDGDMLASGGDDITVRLWDVATGDLLRTLEERTSRVRSAVRSLAFSPDGRALASTNWYEIRLWDVTTGGLKRSLKGHTEPVNSVAFSPDGRTLASGSEDGTVLLWEFSPTINLNATANLSPTSVQSPALGARFTITLTVAAAENVAGYQATLQFDPAAIRFVAHANGDYLKNGAFDASPAVDENSVTVAATSLAGVSGGDGALATLTFEVVDFKDSSLTLSEIILVTADGDRHFPRIENEQAIVVSTDDTGIVGDVNRDGVVNVQDLVLIGANLGQTGRHVADVNGDGIVDIVDLVKVAGEIGNGMAAPPASSEIPSSLSAADVKRWLDLSKGLSLTDATLRRGVLMLENLLTTFSPKETLLLPNYPNPFNPETWIPYHLADDSDVVITIYDVNGILVRQLDLGHRQAGFYADKGHAAYWDGRGLSGESVASGTYFYQLHAGDFSAMRRMVIVK